MRRSSARGRPFRSTKTNWRLGTRRHLCASSFAEPIPLSSTDPGDFRLPATALRICFVLLASRARRKGDNRAARGVLQGVDQTTSRNLQSFLFSTFPQPVGHRVLPPAWTKKMIWRLGTRRLLCARSFAEPVSLSSTDPGDFRLPATALGICLVLLALRARRRGETRAGAHVLQGPGLHNFTLFAPFSFFHISTAMRPTCG
jgi:hypothetical protein